MFNLTLILTIISVGLAFASLFERIGKREQEVIFYMVVFSIQLIGYIIVFVVNFTYTQGGQTSIKIDSYILMVITFLIDLILLTLGLMYFRYNAYRKQTESLLVTLHAAEKEQSSRTIEALEIERNRIAEDLYDDVGAILSTAINYIASVLRKPEIKEKFPALTEARGLIDRSIENLRAVSHNLMPKNFAELGLSKSLQETIEKVKNSSGIEFRFLVIGTEVRLDQAIEIQVFRIASELINDILRNSQATEAAFQLSYQDNSLVIIAEDNGHGKPIYNNLNSKIDFINGKLDIDASDKGVTVIIEIPYRTQHTKQ